MTYNPKSSRQENANRLIVGENMEYDVPEELAAFMDKKFAYDELRNLCVKAPFGFRRAKKCAVKAQYYDRKFWTGFYEIYPKAAKGALSYSQSTQKVSVITPEPEQQ